MTSLEACEREHTEKESAENDDMESGWPKQARIKIHRTHLLHSNLTDLPRALRLQRAAATGAADHVAVVGLASERVVAAAGVGRQRAHQALDKLLDLEAAIIDEECAQQVAQ